MRHTEAEVTRREAGQSLWSLEEGQEEPENSQIDKFPRAGYMACDQSVLGSQVTLLEAATKCLLQA